MARHKKNKKRANGLGTLEKKPNGVFLARWTYKGHKYSRSTGCTVKADAEKKLAEFVRPYMEKDELAVLENLEAKIRIHNNLISAEEAKKPALKISDALDKFFEVSALHNHKVSDGTVKVYTHQFGRFARFVKKYRKVKVSELREVTPKMVKDFLVPLQRELCSSTYNAYLKFMRFLWNTLKDEARLTCNPWEDYSTIDLETTSRRNLTLEELKVLMSSLDGEWKVLFSIGLYSGLRLVDSCKLTWEAIDLTMNRMSVVIQKTKRKNPQPIMIPIHPDLFAVLSSIPKDERSGYVVPECARLYDCGSINYRIKQIFEKCGISTNKETDKRKACLVGFHSLRSGFVTMAAEAGIPFPTIQAIVGHASTRMTEHYFKTSKDSLNQCVNAIPSILSSDVKPKTSVMLETEVVQLLKDRALGSETLDECVRRLVSFADNEIQRTLKLTEVPKSDNEAVKDFWGQQAHLVDGQFRAVS